MRILLTGATGYIGKRLLPVLVDEGNEVICCVREKSRFHPPESLRDKITVLEVDFLNRETLGTIPENIDGAYYLMHSMSVSKEYEKLELLAASNFREAISKTRAVHVVYLSGIVNEDALSKHLSSRRAVEEELSRGTYHLTTLRAGIIIGSGSASFEIIRDLIEKLPVMIAPKWLRTKCQPIAIRDVIRFLERTLFCPSTYDKNFDIGGPEVLTYEEMLMGYAKVRGLKRFIYTIPVMTPKLSSYWLFFITNISYKLAVALVHSMKVEVVCRESNINQIVNIKPMTYEMALKRTFTAIESMQVVSSWKDSLVSGRLQQNISDFINIPVHGCLTNIKRRAVGNVQDCTDRIWNLGGETGWYYATWLWKLRGMMDKFSGGVGLRRGRTDPHKLGVGDSVDFWRVLYADRSEVRLLLFAEMKLPGEAWLEFKITNGILVQTATFRPRGVWGRFYWYVLAPFHAFIFTGLINALAKGKD